MSTSVSAGDLVRRMKQHTARPAPVGEVLTGVAVQLQRPLAAALESTELVPQRRSGGGRRRRATTEQAATRLTVDLEPRLYRSLRMFALDHRCDGSEVIRALLELLGEEPQVAELVADRLKAAGA